MPMNKRQDRHGILRYLVRTETIFCVVVMIALLTLKPSDFYIDQEQSLLYDICIAGVSDMSRIGLFGTDIYQMYTISNVDEWMILFLPAMMSAPFVIALCDEYNSQFMRFTMVRGGFHRYLRNCFRNGICCGLCIGAVALLGYSLFCWITCSRVSALSMEDQRTLYQMMAQRAYGRNEAPSLICFLLPIGKQYAKMMIVFFFAELIAVLFAACTGNKYFSLCIPCLLYYLLQKSSELLTENGYTWGRYLSPTVVLEYRISMILLLVIGICTLILAEECFVKIFGRDVYIHVKE